MIYYAKTIIQVSGNELNYLRSTNIVVFKQYIILFKIYI
jgi:hypothetical protein